MDKNKVLFLNSTFAKSDTVAEDQSIFIEGYANTTDVDRAGDVILSTAWGAGLANYLKNPIILAYHDHDNPIGRMEGYKVDSKGLWVRVRISPAAEEVYGLIKDGVLSAFSVGFRVHDAEYDSVNDLFVIKQVELTEISVVSVPCNQESLFSLAKSFESSKDFESFKNQYVKADTLDKDQETVKQTTIIQTKGFTKMDELEIQAMVAKATAEAVTKANAERDAAEAKKAAAIAAEKAIDEKIAATVAATVKQADSGAEKLLADIEARFEAQTASTKSVLDGLEAAIKEKAAELEIITKSKMRFDLTGDVNKAISDKEMENAVMLKTIMGRSNIGDTKYGSQMLEKAGAHVPGAVPWEQQVSLNMENEIRQKLVVQSLLKQVAMQTNVMKIPLNPATGLGTWVTNAQFGTTASTGAAQTHQLQEITLSAYKVATLEYLAYEEEEDSLLILLPIIRDAMVRRVARSVDQAALRGAGSGADPVKGLAMYATTPLTTDVPVGNKVTVANLRNMRKNLGIFGLDPSEVTYVVSQDVYYDLLDDTAFQTMNQVGSQATLLTGQIGQIGNSPVIVSGEFAAKAAGATGVNVGAIAINTSNFIAGNQRGLRFDTQMLAETQRMALVASLRTGLTQLTSNQGQGVSKLTWVA
jgi:HK97 family phage prohead protease/HK97 family phage major capsid protein